MNKRGSGADIYPQKVLIQNVVWADPARDCVPVGVSKKQRRSEVRVRSAMRCSDRQYVAKKKYTVCSRHRKEFECGSVKATTRGGVFKTVVKDWAVDRKTLEVNWE